MGQKLENAKNRISSSEINKFTYCNYQWYYERLYGGKKLRELKSEMSKKLEYTVNPYSNFRRGTRFHNESYKKIRMQKFIFRMFIIVVMISFIIAVLYFKVISGV